MKGYRPNIAAEQLLDTTYLTSESTYAAHGNVTLADNVPQKSCVSAALNCGFTRSSLSASLGPI